MLPSALDALAPYLAASETGPFSKLSISLPEPLIATVREVSEQTGVSVSGVIAARVRQTRVRGAGTSTSCGSRTSADT